MMSASSIARAASPPPVDIVGGAIAPEDALPPAPHAEIASNRGATHEVRSMALVTAAGMPRGSLGSRALGAPAASHPPPRPDVDVAVVARVSPRVASFFAGSDALV